MEEEISLTENTIGKNLEGFLNLQAELNQRIEDLKVKRELSQAQQEGEMVTVWMMDSWNAAESLRRLGSLLLTDYSSESKGCIKSKMKRTTGVETPL